MESRAYIKKDSVRPPERVGGRRPFRRDRPGRGAAVRCERRQGPAIDEPIEAKKRAGFTHEAVHPISLGFFPGIDCSSGNISRIPGKQRGRTGTPNPEGHTGNRPGTAGRSGHSGRKHDPVRKERTAGYFPVLSQRQAGTGSAVRGRSGPGHGFGNSGGLPDPLLPRYPYRCDPGNVGR